MIPQKPLFWWPGLRRDSGLAEGLIFAFDFTGPSIKSQPERVTGASRLIGSGATSAVGEFGRYIDFSAGDLPLKREFTLQDFTFNALIRDNAGAVSGRLLDHDTAANLLSFTNGTNLRIQSSGETDTITHGLTFASAEWSILTARRRNGTVDVWKNSDRGGTTGSNTGNFVINYNGNPTGSGTFQNIGHAMAWDRALSDHEIRQLAVDPFSLFRRERPKIHIYASLVPENRLPWGAFDRRLGAAQDTGGQGTGGPDGPAVSGVGGSIGTDGCKYDISGNTDLPFFPPLREGLCWRLDPCSGSGTTTIYTTTDLSKYADDYVVLADGLWYSVTESIDCSVTQTVEIIHHGSSCGDTEADPSSAPCAAGSACSHCANTPTSIDVKLTDITACTCAELEGTSTNYATWAFAGLLDTWHTLAQDSNCVWKKTVTNGLNQKVYEDDSACTTTPAETNRDVLFTLTRAAGTWKLDIVSVVPTDDRYIFTDTQNEPVDTNCTVVPPMTNDWVVGDCGDDQGGSGTDWVASYGGSAIFHVCRSAT